MYDPTTVQVQWSVKWAACRTSRDLVLAGARRCALETCGKKMRAPLLGLAKSIYCSLINTTMWMFWFQSDRSWLEQQKTEHGFSRKGLIFLFGCKHIVLSYSEYCYVTRCHHYKIFRNVRSVHHQRFITEFATKWFNKDCYSITAGPLKTIYL